MGKFHDDLVEARRRGEMLPSAEPVAEAKPASPAPFRLPTFVEPTGVPVVCTSCGGLVDQQYTPNHVAWHARIET